MAKKKLYFIGARGFGREIYETFLACTQLHGDIEVAGYLDDKADALDGFEGYPPIIGRVEDFVPSDDDVFVCTLGDSFQRKRYTEIIASKGGNFISLIEPSVYVSPNAHVGRGCMINRMTSISSGCTIGDHVVIQANCIIGHDSVIGDYSTISSFVFMGGGARTEALVTMNPGAILLPHKRMGEGSKAGAGAVMIRNVEPYTTVFGNPAVKL